MHGTVNLTYYFKNHTDMFWPFLKKVCEESHYCLESSGETLLMYRLENGVVSDHSSYYFCNNDEIHIDNLKCGTYQEALENCGPAIMTPNVCSIAIREKLRDWGLIKHLFSIQELENSFAKFFKNRKYILSGLFSIFPLYGIRI